MSLVQFQPRVAPEMTGGRDDGPELRQVFADLASGTTLKLGFVDDIGPLFSRERPSGLLGLTSDVRVVEGTGGGESREDGQTRKGKGIFHHKLLRKGG
jgi:hypothetical protein